MCACAGNYVNFAKLLVNTGVDKELCNPSGENALHLACRCESMECVQLLLERGLKLERKYNYYLTAGEVLLLTKLTH